MIDPAKEPAGNEADWTPSGTWNGGNVWELAERLATAIGIDENVDRQP